MYLDYFGVKEEPFNLTSNPDYFFLSGEHKEALARIEAGFEMEKGLMLLTGEAGVGKTTLINAYLHESRPTQHIAFISNIELANKNLLENICRHFELDIKYDETSRESLINLLYKFVLEESFTGKKVGVIIDDAHKLTNEQLEDLQILSNMETNTRKLFQILLVGLPKLGELLESQNYISLKQHIQMHFQLRSMSYSDTQNYIFYRLALAGYTNKDIFTSDAIQKVFRLSKGNPRMINVICSNALLAAFCANKRKVDHYMIEFGMQEILGQSSTEEALPPNCYLNEKFPPPFKNQAIQMLKSPPWYFWVLLVLWLILAQFGITILVQYLIKHWGIF
ncbi:MAG: AAA family ATPase [Calditrichia bacterium]